MNFFSKDIKEKEEIFNQKKLDYAQWKDELQEINKPFFMIPTDFKHLFLKDISGGALKLFIFLGFHAKYQTGDTWYSASQIASFFEKDERTIANWFEELEKKGLIFREQKGYKMKANTFLRPYGFRFDEIQKDGNTNNRDVLIDVEESKKLSYKPKFGLMLNYAFEEFTFLLIYQEEQIYHCSCFYNFDFSDIKSLRHYIKTLNITMDMYDIDSSISLHKNRKSIIYKNLMNYLDEKSMLR